MIPAKISQHAQIDAGVCDAEEAFVPATAGIPSAKRVSNVRLTHAAVAAGLIVVLLLSLWLKPDPRGLGTHEQLMLFPCNFHRATGLPCPFCGMTTAFAHMARGQVGEALLAQPMGAAGFVACVLLLPVAVGGALTGKDPIGRIMQLPWQRLSKVIVALLTCAWVFKIAVTFLR